MKFLGVETILIDAVPGFNTLETSSKVIPTSQQFYDSKLGFSTDWKNLIKRYLYYRRHIKKIIKSEKPDIVHLHWIFDLPQLAAISIKKIPIISTPYGSDILQFKNFNFNGLSKYFVNHFMTKVIVRNSDYFTCGANHMKTRLVSLGATADKAKLIYFGTDVSIYNSTLKSNNFRNKFGIEKDCLIITSNRGLSHVYDVETLIKAADFLLKTELNMIFLIANDGSLKEKLEELTLDLGIAEKVRFIGKLTESEVIEVTANSDVYVSTSSSDGGLAVSIAEAMACEIPVVISKFEENELWLENESAGFSFEIGNWEKLAEKIEILLRDPKKRYEMGKIGRQIVVRSRNKEQESVKMLKFYEEILHSRK
jgi:glycosyltransferase involved in cell wall biosynthesis